MKNSHYSTSQSYYYYSVDADIKDFYKDFNINSFESITKEDVEKLKTNIEKINNRKILANVDTYYNSRRYANLMNHIKRNLSLYKITSSPQKYVLFMLCIDPNFDALFTTDGSTNISSLRKNMVEKFGVFDINLIRLENWFIKKFYTNEDRKIK